MKAALCYYGNIGWYLNDNGDKVPLPPSICFASVKKHILQLNEHVDIFIHSWSKESEQDIISVLNPKAFKIEPQITFNPILARHNEINQFADIKSLVAKKLKNFILNEDVTKDFESLRRAYSRWYSTQQVIHLKRQYEEKTGVRYDYVMLNRFDIDWYSDIVFQNYNPEFFYSADPSDLNRKRHNYLIEINDVSYRPKNRAKRTKPYIHRMRESLGCPKTPFWVQPRLLNSFLIKARMNHYNLSDTWFFAGSRVMDRFGDLFQQIQKYNASPHIAAFQHITSILKNEQLRFPFEQFTDFELYRFSKACGVQHPLGF